MPSAVDTVTFTLPEPLAADATSRESESTLKDFAAAPPKCTCVAPLKPEPDTSTRVPPSSVPDDGASAVTLGIPGAL